MTEKLIDKEQNSQYLKKSVESFLTCTADFSCTILIGKFNFMDSEKRFKDQ